MTSKCLCPQWYTVACNESGECQCYERCCNTGYYADDGDGRSDFMIEKSACSCPEPKDESND